MLVDKAVAQALGVANGGARRWLCGKKKERKINF